MQPRKRIDSARTPDGSGELALHRHGDDFFICFDNRELMGSRMHASEEMLAELACRPIAQRVGPRVLIGGLGLGYTLSAARSVPSASCADITVDTQSSLFYSLPIAKQVPINLPDSRYARYVEKLVPQGTHGQPRGNA